jgi:hypothetical protein
MLSGKSFQLILKRNQSKENGQRMFTLTAMAEMTSEFEEAVKEYNLWNEFIYVDSRVEENRQLYAQQGERRAERSSSFFDNFVGDSLANLALYLTYKTLKLIFIGPFKLAWWIFKATRTQKQQMMRFHEIKEGKTFSSNDLAELAQIEETITERCNGIVGHVTAALNYSGDVTVVPSTA